LVDIGMKPQSSQRFDYTKREPSFPGGVDVRVDLQKLIQEVRTSPGAKWLRDLTYRVTHTYHLRVNVDYTELDTDPIH